MKIKEKTKYLYLSIIPLRSNAYYNLHNILKSGAIDLMAPREGFEPPTK